MTWCATCGLPRRRVPHRLAPPLAAASFTTIRTPGAPPHSTAYCLLRHLRPPRGQHDEITGRFRPEPLVVVGKWPCVDIPRPTSSTRRTRLEHHILREGR